MLSGAPSPHLHTADFYHSSCVTGNDSSTCFLSSPNTSVFGQPELHSVFYATTLGNSLIYPGRSRPAVRRRGLHWLTLVTPFRDRKGTNRKEGSPGLSQVQVVRLPPALLRARPGCCSLLPSCKQPLDLPFILSCESQVLLGESRYLPLKNVLEIN